MRQRASNNPLIRAFTLFEMSIVIVVITLVLATTYVATDLLHSSKLMTVLSQAEEIRSHAKNFKDKYAYYPGDFPHATTTWTAMTTPIACDTTGGTSQGQDSTTTVDATCDGRGNGVIGNTFTDSAQFSHTGNTDLREQRERFYFWQHLALAGFIKGQYSGYSTTNGNDTAVTPGVNVLKTDFSDALGFVIEYSVVNNLTQDTTAAYPVAGRLGHLLSWSPPDVGISSDSLINSQDAWNLDNKVDDGLPLSGNIFVRGQETGDPYNVSRCLDETNLIYYTDGTSRQCGQYYRNFLEE